MLVAILGNLGKGKTLTLTYLAWNNFFIRRKKIYSNYDLYGIPYTKITTIGSLESLMPLEDENVLNKQEVVFLGDELWRWVSCLPPSSNIPTTDGVVKLGNLHTTIFAADFSSAKIVPSSYSAKSVRPVLSNEKLLRISTRTREIICSKNHKFFIINRDPNFYNRHNGDNWLKFVREIEAKNLRVKDRVLLAYKIPEPKEELISPKLARLLGYMLGDGAIDHYRGHIVLVDKNEKCLERYADLAVELGFSVKLKKDNHSDSYILRIYGKGKILGLLKMISDAVVDTTETYARFVDIPLVVQKSNNNVLREFIAGFIDAEGHIRIEKNLDKKFGKVEIVNSKKYVLEKLKMLLLRFGIDAKLERGSDKKYEWYRLIIRDSLSLRELKAFNLYHSEKAKVLSEIPIYKSKRKIIGDIEIGYITSIEEIDPVSQELIDLEVPGYSNFVVDGFIVHNSRTIGKGAKAVKDLIDRILLGSRKAFVTVIYTTQNLAQVDPWVRRTTDLFIYPILYNGILNIYFLSNPVSNPTLEQLYKYSTDKPLRVLAEPFYAMFNTYQRVPPLQDGYDDMVERVVNIRKNPALQRYIFIDKQKDAEYFEKYCQHIEKKFWLYNEETYERDFKEGKLPYQQEAKELGLNQWYLRIGVKNELGENK